MSLAIENNPLSGVWRESYHLTGWMVFFSVSK